MNVGDLRQPVGESASVPVLLQVIRDEHPICSWLVHPLPDVIELFEQDGELPSVFHRVVDDHVPRHVSRRPVRRVVAGQSEIAESKYWSARYHIVESEFKSNWPSR